MARHPREYSGSGFYHIMFRGVNHQPIFAMPKDYHYMLSTIKQVKEEAKFKLSAYCLMTNHVHLLLKEEQLGDISGIMQKILTKYSMYFNRKYDRYGALIGSRYKSKVVEQDAYFIPLTVYIHQNPVRAGIVDRAMDYPYSSYHEYAAETFKLTDPEMIKALIDTIHWRALHERLVKSEFSFAERHWTDIEVCAKVMALAQVGSAGDLANLDRPQRDAVLATLKAEGVPIRQIGKVTGLSRGVVAKSR